MVLTTATPKTPRKRAVSRAKPAAAEAKPRNGSKHDDKLDTILRTAAQLFAENGYEASSLDMLADRMGMHKATLYHYIEGKEWILLQCLLRSFGDVDEVMQRIQDKSVPVMERLRYFLVHLALAQNNDFGRCFALVGSQALDKIPGGEVRKYQKRLDQAVRDLVLEGIDSGSIRPCDPALVSAMMFGALNWVPRWLKPKHGMSVEQVAEGFCEILVQGIGRPAA